MDALRHELTVACDAARAFDLFTSGMGSWWDPAYTSDPATFTGIAIGAEVGAEVSMIHGPHRFSFGRITVWEPPRHYAQSFWLLMAPAQPTRLDVRFVDVAGVCEVVLEHDGWNAANRSRRARYDEWPMLLGRFADAAARLA